MVQLKCAVAQCPTKARSKAALFPFPLKDPALLENWVRVCHREEIWTPNASSRVCELHFNPEDIVTVQYGKKVVRRVREGTIPSQNLPEGAPMVVTVTSAGPLSDNDEEAVVSIAGHHVQLETVVTDGTHYDTMEHVSQHDITRITVSASPLSATLHLDDPKEDDSIIRPKMKRKSIFNPDIIPEDISANTMNVDHGYFLSFLPPKEAVAEAGDLVEPDALYCGSDLAASTIEGQDDDQDEDMDCRTSKIANMTAEQKIAKLVSDLKIACRKNRALARANKSLRLQLHQASKKTLSMRSKHDVAREVLAPFFTPTQIDCFCRPKWIRSRNWMNKDFELALSLRKVMSKKAFSYLRKKRLVPMPSLTSLRKYQRINGITINHSNKGVASGSKRSKVKPAASGAGSTTGMLTGHGVKGGRSASKNVITSNTVVVNNAARIPVMSNGMVSGANLMVASLDASVIDTAGNLTFSDNLGNKFIQAIQIPVAGQASHPIQLQVVEAMPTTSASSKVARVKALDDNWKFIQIASSPDGTSTYTIQQK